MEAIMAGVVGIVAFIFKPVQDAIAEPIKDRFKYLCCFTDNVKDLEKEAPKLEDIRSEVQSKVERAQNNAEEAVPRVQTWLNDVSKIQTKKPDIDNEVTTTINGGCCTIRSRYLVSKKVKKMAEKMKELREESEKFETNIALPRQAEARAPTNRGSTNEFDSRKRIGDEIMSSLREEGTNKVGICGMGGVGKTTMAKTIMHRAREELGFEETVMAIVGQNVDKLIIQADIAKSLDLTLSAEGKSTLSAEGSLSSNANELHKRLKEGSIKSLIVIDDVWEKLDVEELGIPCSNTCKVLITSRDSHVLDAMDAKKLHAVDVLSKTEAWELFKSKAGNCIEHKKVVDVARKVVDECKGLPLALAVVGVALKNRVERESWDNALNQLKSANPRHVPWVIKDVYQPLMLSYHFLEDEHHKSLFLMCCLFPEDSNIPLERLAIMCKGLLHMNEDIKSSRDNTFDLVVRLKDCFLLLEGYDENHVQMHDVVRDVAIFIAAEEKRIKCNECTWISSDIGERFGAHGGSSLFPNLHLLWIDCESRDKELEIQNDFFGGMIELKVIMIKCLSLKQLPETIGLLKNLRTLVLERCESLERISVVGELSSLEILIFRFCITIVSLPVAIGRLSQLRLLELSGCWNLRTIAPGIISNLIELEELIVDGFDGWEARTIVEGERKNASLCELEKLVRLSSLTIEIRDSGLAAENLYLFSPTKFNITIGNGPFLRPSFWEKTLRLELSRYINLGKWIHECVKNVECLHLEGDGSSVLNLQVAQNLKELEISGCSSLKNLGNTPFHQLEQLWLTKLGELKEIMICDISNLKKLSSISVEGCGKLRSLFSMSSVMESGSGCFLHLKTVVIRSCKMMEQVLMLRNEEEQKQSNILLFAELEVIQLDHLPKLTSFINGIQTIEFPQLHQIYISRCPLLKELVRRGSATHRPDDQLQFSCDHPHMVKFGKLSKLAFEFGVNLCLQAPTLSFTTLRELNVTGLHGVKSLFSFSMTESSCLSQLEKLEIRYCDMMEQVILWKEDENQMGIHSTVTLFPKLKFLELRHLPRLTSVIMSKGIGNFLFPLPPEMRILGCPLLESCASPNDRVEFDRLKELEIYGNLCPQIPMTDLFAGLCKLVVSCFDDAESLFPCSIARMMPNIKTLLISWCSEMMRVIEDDVENQTTTPICVFPKLEFLVIDTLPKLRHLCEWRCGLELPLLRQLEINNCGMVKEFTLGPLIAPNLITLIIDDHDLNGKDVNNDVREKRHEAQKLEKTEGDHSPMGLLIRREIQMIEIESQNRYLRSKQELLDLPKLEIDVNRELQLEMSRKEEGRMAIEGLITIRGGTG